MKEGLDWDLKIDRIASCYITKRLMTNVITYVSFPKDYDMLGMYSDRDRDQKIYPQKQKNQKNICWVLLKPHRVIP